MPTITIQPSNVDDIDAIMAIYEQARAFMRAHGNATQWEAGYPPRQLIEDEIATGRHFSCHSEGEPVGVFSFIIGEDPTYAYIDGEGWLSDASYGTIHRLASSGRVRGIGAACIAWCAARCSHLRADTHRNNRVMQQLLLRHGFVPRGIIYVRDGSARIAYERID